MGVNIGRTLPNARSSIHYIITRLPLLRVHQKKPPVSSVFLRLLQAHTSFPQDTAEVPAPPQSSSRKGSKGSAARHPPFAVRQGRAGAQVSLGRGQPFTCLLLPGLLQGWAKTRPRGGTEGGKADTARQRTCARARQPGKTETRTASERASESTDWRVTPAGALPMPRPTQLRREKAGQRSPGAGLDRTG